MLRALVLALALLAPSAALGQGFYVEKFGGVTGANDLYYDGSLYDMNAGHALGGALGFETGIPGLAIEIDVLYSDANYACCTSSESALTVMKDLVYTVPLGDRFSIFGGAGAGIAFVTYHCDCGAGNDDSGTSAAWQAFGGASLALSDRFSIFGELRYQSAFGEVLLDPSDSNYYVEYNRGMALIGLRYSTD